jgi:hypothetical protein
MNATGCKGICTLELDWKEILKVQPMTAAERIYQLANSLPAEQVDKILDFAEFLYQKQLAQGQTERTIPPGTLMGLRGIAKRAGKAPSDEELQEDYADYLTNKYQ